MRHAYEPFFGFHTKPFSLLPDPRFLFESPGHATALAMLEYGLAEQPGLVVLTGESGTGKTLLLRHLAEALGEGVAMATVACPHPALGEPWRWALLAFGLDEAEGESPARQHRHLLAHLRELQARGRRAALVIDEAQGLGAAALEGLRLLSDLDEGGERLLRLVLAGRPGLRRTLQRPGHESLLQRVSAAAHLEPLRRDGTVAYIRHRLAGAGGDPGLIEEEAALAAHYFARGIPRLINGLCDLALILAFAEGQRRVGLAAVVEAAMARLQGGLSGLRPLPPLRPVG
jgi:type II secretory pathway predicted ATPase ExeA